MRAACLSLAFLLAAPAQAEIVSQNANAFHVRHSVQVVVPPEQAYALLTTPSRWWDPEHSYSGDSANLLLDLRPGGCFCERLPDSGGFVEHLRLVQLKPGEALVFTGGLGPLTFEAATGTMVWSVEKIAGGSRISLDYRAFGFPKGNGAALAGPVDRVLGEQMKRLRRQAAAGNRRDIP
ncbi:SRPBCC family protein [Sphingomicrobium lutaoense]|uniref:Uncharacterized protein YndB with AHSA1/START domain n=1 Tax=Sphingomicrobium lutaoense TaxID=515949 RepID=A0A839Z6C3_9SPHN|nr:SRPBCC domain-containing protein [Sphingomicrobium lutaoense]MBB3764264.1 uncharacterized protein YndB with AHSA1/START domain [Sphingomicrobium lutaoense]